MKYILLLMFFLPFSKPRAQLFPGGEVADRLEKSRFYFIGQAHNNQANTLIEKELLLVLNSRYGVSYDIIEYAHSAAFLVNQFLLSGNDSLLAFINSDANFNFIKAIKTHNDTVKKERQIYFYGLDFENRQEGRHIKKSIEIILQQSKMTGAGSLSSLLKKIIGSSFKDLESNLVNLRNFLSENEQQCRLALGNYFLDVLLIVNAQYDFSQRRDGAMIANFRRLYKELEKNETPPSFFASFGTGHVNPNNRDGLAMRLLNEDESPVKNKVCIIGIQYLNCRFDKELTPRPTEGNMDFLCRASVFKGASEIEGEQNETIRFLPREYLSQLNCNKAINTFSGVFLVSNFGASRFWTWE